MSTPARSWSPPLESHTRTTTSISVVRARPEHLKDIHGIQVLAYPERTDFHEDEDVFRSKLEMYPAGNFVAVATYSVVTNDDTSTWQHVEVEDKEGEEEEMEVDEEEEEEEEEEEVSQTGDGQQQRQGDDITTGLHEVSVVEIIETAPDGTTTTATATSAATTGETPTLRARTPDITAGGEDDSEDETGLGRTQGRSSRHLRSTSASANKGKGRDAGDGSDEDDMTTILVQWEQPIGYLFSHPYSRESMTLHCIGGYTDRSEHSDKGKDKEKGHPTMKKVRLDTKIEHGDSASESESEESEQDPYEHDQKMEKYYIHDCAVHPDWRGRGLASRLWKALEESLAPVRDDDTEHLRKEGDLVDTEDVEEEEVVEEEEGEKEEEQNEATEQEGAEREQVPPHHHGHRRRRGGSRRKRRNRRVGAPNLKEIVLVSVQGTRPFWENAGGFQVVPEHDHDLSVYGTEAFMMSAPFRYWR
ncbi:hypothetical protein BG011_000297 [Mortierella polycephala]|uniref:N-acetyltransferase domain-containing protein n=1 Tax=Mortierella polycephala TaxID=41804 RepID=A0A9P6TUX4_9FUNG|nr:hypothetical protein BG011_000297 [Mortierella polycephala]